MSKENIACCMVCQMTFSTHEELFVHSCAQIKVEKPEPDDDNQIEKAEKIVETFNQEEFKYDMDPQELSESDSDYSPKKKKIKKEKKSKIIKVARKKEKVKLKPKPKKKIPKVDKYDYETDYQKQLDLALCNSNLQLSEEFIVFILTQVDNLCENIKNGDPDVERTLEVNQSLNNAVTCYRNKLSLEKQILIKSEDQEYYNDQIETTYDSNHETFDESDDSKSQKRKKKGRGRPGGVLINKKMELVKNQCGRHSVLSLSTMLNMNHCTLIARIKNSGITFVEKQVECHFCEIQKSNENIDKSLVFPFIEFDNDKEKFKCSLCDFLTPKRGVLFSHIKSIHKTSLSPTNSAKIEEKFDCGKAVCRRLYGIAEGKIFWCKSCVELDNFPKPTRQRKENLLRNNSKGVKATKLCPECGISVKHLKLHLTSVHYPEKQICPHCAQELRSVETLRAHIKKVHEKVPCAECGMLVGQSLMTRHIQAKHTPNHLKKYKCEVCGKGFATNQHLNDHKNIHTGEKPYKCKYCTSRFASKGTHAMHEKGHLGHKRNSSKT